MASQSRIEQEMLEVRRAFSTAFKATVGVIVALVVATGIAIILVAFRNDASLSEKLLVARFIQVSFGMTIGSACVFLGVLLIWLGITASVNASASTESAPSKAGIAVTTTSPGIVIALSGVILVALSLYRPVSFTETFVESPRIEVHNKPPPGV